MTDRQRAVMLLGVRTAQAVRRHVELNPQLFSAPHEVEAAYVRELVAQVSQPEASPDLQRFLQAEDDRSARRWWTRLENDAVRYAAQHLGLRRNWWD